MQMAQSAPSVPGVVLSISLSLSSEGRGPAVPASAVAQQRSFQGKPFREAQGPGAVRNQQPLE